MYKKDEILKQIEKILRLEKKIAMKYIECLIILDHGKYKVSKNKYMWFPKEEEKFNKSMQFMHKLDVIKNLRLTKIEKML